MNRDCPDNPRLAGRRLSDPRLSDPQLSDRGRAREDEKRQRLAEALRDNLRKRKAQLRGRAAGEPDQKGGGEA